MNPITLTQAQRVRLARLEDDEAARVIGVLYDCPVVKHTGSDQGRKFGYEATSVIRPHGRLVGLGRQQVREFYAARGF